MPKRDDVNRSVCEVPNSRLRVVNIFAMIFTETRELGKQNVLSREKFSSHSTAQNELEGIQKSISVCPTGNANFTFFTSKDTQFQKQ